MKRMQSYKLHQVVAVIACTFAIVLFIHYGPPRFWGDFTGMTEGEVRGHLGEPFRDSRERQGDEETEYTLGWYQGFEQGLFLKFQDGMVVSQDRISR